MLFALTERLVVPSTVPNSRRLIAPHTTEVTPLGVSSSEESENYGLIEVNLFCPKYRLDIVIYQFQMPSQWSIAPTVFSGDTAKPISGERSPLHMPPVAFEIRVLGRVCNVKTEQTGRSGDIVLLEQIGPKNATYNVLKLTMVVISHLKGSNDCLLTRFNKLFIFYNSHIYLRNRED
ncbi:hypothetical protein J6590_041070 [Homalodisca vitripennis]|nr:hypothetical protein J6590_041070 [Homalodisca vitripennis]